MDPELEKNWGKIVAFLEEKTGMPVDMQAAIYLVGVREFGAPDRKFKKDDKLNLMHISVCRLLEPFGYYSYEGHDPDGWPHYTVLQELPPLNEKEQQELMKRALVAYFGDEGIIEYGL